MEGLLIKQTASTLGVDFAPQTGTLVMHGESYPENALQFFTPILVWLETYVSNLQPGSRTSVDLNIVYFNSSSSKALMNIFDVLDGAAQKGCDISITWRHHVENGISRECGQEFAEDLTAVRFEIKAYEDIP